MNELEQTFVCYLCGKTKPTAEQAMPCSYTRHFGQPVCVTCCEGCNAEEPFPCPDYEIRKRSERTPPCRINTTRPRRSARSG